jgi:hypothetical protein
MKFFFKLTIISFFLLTNTNSIEIKINKLGDLKKLGDAVKKEITQDKQKEQEEKIVNSGDDEIKLEDNSNNKINLNLTNDVDKKFIISYEKKGDDKSQNYMVRIGWFNNDTIYTVKLPILSNIDYSNNTFTQSYEPILVYQGSITTPQKDYVEMRKMRIAAYDRTSYEAPEGNYNIIYKDFENIYDFKLDFNNQNIIYSLDNKSLPFKLTEKEINITNKLEYCFEDTSKGDAKTKLEKYKKVKSTCRDGFKEITDLLLRDNKLFVSAILERTNPITTNNNIKQENRVTFLGLNWSMTVSEMVKVLEGKYNCVEAEDGYSRPYMACEGTPNTVDWIAIYSKKYFETISNNNFIIFYCGSFGGCDSSLRKIKNYVSKETGVSFQDYKENNTEGYVGYGKDNSKIYITEGVFGNDVRLFRDR